MQVFATKYANLFMMQQDGETTYTKQGGGEFVVNGEQGDGEAWVHGEHMYYTRLEDEGVVVLANEDTSVVHEFADTEDGWADFANSVT